MDGTIEFSSGPRNWSLIFKTFTACINMAAHINMANAVQMGQSKFGSLEYTEYKLMFYYSFSSVYYFSVKLPFKTVTKW